MDINNVKNISSQQQFITIYYNLTICKLTSSVSIILQHWDAEVINWFGFVCNDFSVDGMENDVQ